MPSSQHRREEILRLVGSGAPASVTALATRFTVSESTVRRDLSRLQDAGHLTRTHGGAVGARDQAESNLRQRLGEFHDAKLAIARWAAAEVRQGEVLALDAGSTVAALAHQFRTGVTASIATTSLAVAQELSRSEQITLHMLGGTMRGVSQSFVGPIAEATLEGMTFDRVFLGADGVDAELGICEADPQQTRLKRLLADRAGEVYVLAHAQKLQRRPFHAWARLPLPWTLVTDARPDQTTRFAEAGVRVVAVDGTAPGP